MKCRIKLISRKKFKTSVISKLREEKLLPDRANHLCNSCYNEFVKRRQLDDVQERILDEGASNPVSTETIEEQANVKLVLEQLISLLEKRR